MTTLHEDPRGVAVHRRVIVGYIGRGPTGHPLCLQCGVRERNASLEGGHATLFCSASCRTAHRARPTKARWQPCPVCGVPCIRCSRGVDCRAVWEWYGRTPVRRGTMVKLHGGYGR